jgi:hypothetical protein
MKYLLIILLAIAFGCMPEDVHKKKEDPKKLSREEMIPHDTIYSTRIIHVITPSGHTNYWLEVITIDSCQYFTYDTQEWTHLASCTNPKHRMKENSSLTTWSTSTTQ